MQKGNLLIIGGTGITGSQIALEGMRRGYTVYVISLEKVAVPTGVQRIVINRNSTKYSEHIQLLNKQIGSWDLVVDGFAFDKVSASSTYDLFKNNSKHIITISTTLVYDRSQKFTKPISEENPLAKKGVLGGYVDGKLELEQLWKDITDVPWTIVRPYHILGAGSLLGCIPQHNRDPHLIQTLKDGDPLNLCEGGNIELNYIHPRDIASAMFAIAQNPKTFRQAYNLVNPTVILAKDYYAEIARQVGGKLKIKDISIQKVWEELKGWEMATLPHVYSAKKITQDTKFTATIPLAEGIRDAIQYHPAFAGPTEEIPIHERMNKLPRPKPISWLAEYYVKLA